MKTLNIDFLKIRKPYLIVMGTLLVIAIVLTVIMGVPMGIEFTGGTIMRYSFTGEVDLNAVDDIVNEITGADADVRLNEGVQTAAGDTTENQLSLSFSDQIVINTEVQKALTDALQEKFSGNGIENIESDAVDPTMGLQFLGKCLVAILLAAVMIIIYVGFRFRKIGGITAGIMGLCALVMDIFMAYFAVVVFQYPINENFVAVVLTILGFSINDTIVIFDRIRENRRLMGPKASLTDVVNKSMNQTLARCVWTCATAFLAMVITSIVALVYNLEVILTFSVPMMVGLLGGLFSTIFFAPTNWAVWQTNVYKKEAEKRIAGRKKTVKG